MDFPEFDGRMIILLFGLSHVFAALLLESFSSDDVINAAHKRCERVGRREKEVVKKKRVLERLNGEKQRKS